MSYFESLNEAHRAGGVVNRVKENRREPCE